MNRVEKVLMIDNFDSFTYILVDYFKQLDCQVDVLRNDVSEIESLLYKYDLLVMSPGPSIPSNAGNLMNLIEMSFDKIPIFGVCLGLQALVEFFGGSIIKNTPKHGKKDKIWVDQQTIFQDLPQNVTVGRYHSLSVLNLPVCFELSAKSEDGTIMAIRHKSLPIEGVQFHPESILSSENGVGFKIIQNLVLRNNDLQ